MTIIKSRRTALSLILIGLLALITGCLPETQPGEPVKLQAPEPKPTIILSVEEALDASLRNGYHAVAWGRVDWSA